MKKWIRRFLEAIGWIPPTQIVAALSPDYPQHEAIPAGVLHVVGGQGYMKWAYLTCPCRCGAPIMLSLAAARHPHWQVQIDWLDRPTIKPSIWQTEGCFSHFWIRQGRLDWVGDTGKGPPPANFYA